MLDYLLKNATIVDGSGAPAYVGTVGVKDGKICLNCADAEAKEVIDCTGKHLFPGFIDIHSHGDVVLGEEYGRLCKINQGITTEVTGNCGSSMFPINPEPQHLKDAQIVLSVCRPSFPDEMKEWTSFKNYKEYVKTLKLSSNAKIMTGHGILRLAVMDMDNRKPTPEEMQKMKDLLRETMEEGSFGLSTGLIYPPGCYAEEDEIVELLSVVKEYGGIYATHMRNEADTLVEATEEAIRIAKRADVPLWISHHKACGKGNWGKPKQTLKLIADAIAEGMDITVDQYPYPATMTNIKMCVPPEYFAMGAEKLTAFLKTAEGRAEIKAKILDESYPFENQWRNCGGFSGIYISSLPETPEYAGMFVADAAKKMGKEEFEAYFDILAMNGTIGGGIFYAMCQEDMNEIISAPFAVTGTDGICRGRYEVTHPRAWGTFPHALNLYVKDQKILTLEEMIHKFTEMPAKAARLATKGLIKDGYDADLLVVDYDNFVDRATFTNSTELCDGVDFVMVNGVIAYKDKALTDAAPGKLLLHNGK